MPKHLAARPSLDATEEAQVRRLARSHHAPADWVVHARMIARSWDGLRTAAIADELYCHPRQCANACTPSTNAGSTGWG
jgi:hypothetical protein